MAKFINTFSVLFLALLMLGSFAGTVSAGKITVLRTLMHVGSFNTIYIFINGKKIGGVENGKRVTFASPNGNNKIEPKVNGLFGEGALAKPITYSQKPGGNYFIVGWKYHIIAPYFVFKETTRAEITKLEQRYKRHKKEIMGGDPFADQ